VSDNLPGEKQSTASVSESENPEIPSPTPTTIRPRTNQGSDLRNWLRACALIWPFVIELFP
jgi:hypothetical protein